MGKQLGITCSPYFDMYQAIFCRIQLVGRLVDTNKKGTWFEPNLSNLTELKGRKWADY